MENRSPFLDSDLYRAAYSIPTEQHSKRDSEVHFYDKQCVEQFRTWFSNQKERIGFNAPISIYLITLMGIFETFCSKNLIF